jgi:hypothetical protein
MKNLAQDKRDNAEDRPQKEDRQENVRLRECKPGIARHGSTSRAPPRHSENNSEGQSS